jgi:hypothetical protein
MFAVYVVYVYAIKLERLFTKTLYVTHKNTMDRWIFLDS